MRVQVRGSCHSCHEPVVYLKFHEGKVVIVVACNNCQEDVHFDLESMVDALKSNGGKSVQ